MTVLYLDTSSSLFCAALYQDGKVTQQIRKKLEKEMSKEALPLLKKLLEDAKVAPQEVDQLLVCNGPGSFTGIRIGMTIAKVYAWALQKEITMVSSLEAMAASISSERVLSLIDARRGYVYGALYEKNKPLIQEGYYLLTELLEQAKSYAPYQIVSQDSFDALTVVPYQPDFQKIITLYAKRESISPHLANPCYLKKTEAEEKQNG